MNIKRSFTALSALLKRLLNKETSVMEKHRMIMLLFCYIPICVLDIIANLVGISGPPSVFFNYTHALFLLLFAISLFLFFTSKITVSTCLSLCTLVCQMIISVEMIYCAYNSSEYHLMLIVANTVLLSINMMFSMSAFMKINTMILGIMTIGVYVACMLITGDTSLQSFLIVFVISFLFIAVIGLLMAKVSYMVEKENKQLKKDEAEVLNILRLKKEEVKAYISLATEKYSNDGTQVLLERLDKKTRYNLLANVEAYMKSRETELKIIESSFPDFTPSERDICRLILQNKKLGEICTILGKTETNINSQRANMRKKLGLQSSENLLEKLQQRLNQNSL